jgi:excisionase family DNA binding protein
VSSQDLSLSPGLTVNDLLEAVAVRVAEILSAQQPAPEPSSPWLTVAEAADYSKMTPDAIRGAEKRGRLKGHRSETGRVRFLRSDLDAFLTGQA